MKTKNYRLFSMVSSLVLAVGILVGIKPACAGWMYQVKAPKHLSVK